jgi:hypothetical protein
MSEGNCIGSNPYFCISHSLKCMTIFDAVNRTNNDFWKINIVASKATCPTGTSYSVTSPALSYTYSPAVYHTYKSKLDEFVELFNTRYTVD